MSTAAVAVITTLPANGDLSTWDDGHKAMAEAAGLVFTHAWGPREGQREVADRATTEKFLHVCRTTGLDPLTRQIYCIGRASKGQIVWSIQTSIDGFRVIAERSGHYAGQDDAEWLTEKGEWVDVFVKQLHGAHPLAARVRVHRHDWTKPSTGIATWESYAQTTSKGALTSMWDKMGPLMLAKCAEALGLRKAFPHDLSGLYTADEMSQATVAVEAPAQQAAIAPAAAPAAPPAAVQHQQAQTPAPAAAAAVPTVQHAAGPDWVQLANAATSADEAMLVFSKAREVGALGQLVDFNGEQIQLRHYIAKIGEALKHGEAQAAATSAPAGVEVQVSAEGSPSAIWDPDFDVNPNTGEVA